MARPTPMKDYVNEIEPYLAEIVAKLDSLLSKIDTFREGGTSFIYTKEHSG